ncbi:MAG TPA: hypothetical protein VF783_07840 [Terriglobales bacterium]
MKPLSSEPLFEAGRYSFIGAAVTNVEWFLRGVRLPRRSVFNRHVRIRSQQALLSPDNSPFNLRGFLLVDHDLEL